MPRTLHGAPELSAAERGALAVLAEHARARARLDCVWLFAHPTRPDSDSAIELVATASSRGSQPLAEATARAAIGRAARDDRRRFDRGRGAEAAGTRVATATRATSAVSAAGQPADAADASEVERALAELAHVGLRFVAGAVAPADEAGAAAGLSDATSTGGTGRAPAFGSGLGPAIARLQQPPVLPESRARLRDAVETPDGSPAEVLHVVETDIGLALAVVARANRMPTRPRTGFTSVPEAVKALGPRQVAALATTLPALRANAGGDQVCAALGRITPHAITTRAAADTLAVQTGSIRRDCLRLAALLHDVGKVVFAAASRDYLDQAVDPRVAPGERIAAERRLMGIDHAGIGAIALARLGVPKGITTAVERHHAADADGGAAVIRLADMLAHEAHGARVDPAALAAAGEALGIASGTLCDLVYELARAGGPRSASGAPSPLTPMQHKVLLGLRRGMTYKQIAADLQVSESTVRSHLHKAYERLGVVDRAQAVLLAQDRGWI